VQEDTGLEIVKRIMLCFHRGERIQHTLKAFDYWRKVALYDSFTARSDKPGKLRREAQTLFKRLDTGNNGHIGKSDLCKGFPQLDSKTVDVLMTEADTDHDDLISFEEFWVMIVSVRQVLAEDEALEIFNAIDKLPAIDCNGRIELFEIFLYAENNLRHLFERHDAKEGAWMIDQGQLRKFVETLRGQIDLDNDGKFSREQFQWAYCIWLQKSKKEEEELHERRRDVFGCRDLRHSKRSEDLQQLDDNDVRSRAAAIEITHELYKLLRRR